MADFVRVPYIPVDVGEGLRLRANKPSHGVVAIEQGDEYLLHKVGHGVRGKSCPRHGLGFFGVEDMAQQYPIYPKGGNGFGVVGGEAGRTSLADVDLPAAEIGGGWFHVVGFSNAKIYTN
jgi:hypothetical protein